MYDEVKNHTCGDPDFVLDPTIISELEKIFEQNLALKPNEAYHMLFSQKGSGNSIREMARSSHVFVWQ